MASPKHSPPTRKPDPIALAPAVYWELRARVGDVQAIELELLQARLAGQARLIAAQQRVNRLLISLEPQGVRAETTYDHDDARCALVPKDKQTTT